MKIRSGTLRSLLSSCIVASVGGAWLAGACTPLPTNDPLGWSGRGMTLPAEMGAAGRSADAGGGTRTGAAGSDPTMGSGEAGNRGGAGLGGEAGTSGSGAAGVSAAGGSSSATGAAGSSVAAAGASGAAGSTRPPADAGAPPPGDGGPPAGTTCHLDVAVTTHSGGGSHAPKNVDAIWIEDAGGRFVKSLYVMARNEIQHLNAWNTATTAANLSRNRIDAVTGATLPGYGTRVASWNCTDVNQKPVALGVYQVCFDLNDGNGSDKQTCDNLTFGKTAAKLMPPDALPSFTGRVLTYTP